MIMKKYDYEYKADNGKQFVLRNVPTRETHATLSTYEEGHVFGQYVYCHYVDDGFVAEVDIPGWTTLKGYEVVYATRHIENVKLCDVLLVVNFSRISRKQIEFVKIYKYFKANGIRIESVSGNNVDSMFSAKEIYKAFEQFEKEFKKQD